MKTTKPKRQKLSHQGGEWNAINTTIHYFILKGENKTAVYSFSVGTDIAGFVRMSLHPQKKQCIGEHINTVIANHPKHEHHIIK